MNVWLLQPTLRHAYACRYIVQLTAGLHDAYWQDEQSVCHQLVCHHQHNANDLGGTVGEDGKRIACTMSPAVDIVQ
jgi:hypothetical protein